MTIPALSHRFQHSLLPLGEGERGGKEDAISPVQMRTSLLPEISPSCQRTPPR